MKTLSIKSLHWEDLRNFLYVYKSRKLRKLHRVDICINDIYFPTFCSLQVHEDPLTFKLVTGS